MRGELPGNTLPQSSGGLKKKSRQQMDFDDESLLLEKKLVCPVCDRRFSTKRVGTGKALYNGQDLDLRPRYRNIDAIKYRVVECPYCGFADLDKYFPEVNKHEKEVLLENITIKDEDDEYISGGVRSYDTAYASYKAALRCNLIKGAKCSKRGITALYTAWLLRGWREALEEQGDDVEADAVMGLLEENRLIKYALRNFQEAEVSEQEPLQEIGEFTLDYIIAALLYMKGEYVESRKHLVRILTSRTVNNKLKIQAEDLRDLIREAVNQES